MEVRPAYIIGNSEYSLYARHCAKYLTCAISLNPHNYTMSYTERLNNMPNCIAGSWKRQSSNPSFLISNSTLYHTIVPSMSCCRVSSTLPTPLMLSLSCSQDPESQESNSVSTNLGLPSPKISGSGNKQANVTEPWRIYGLVSAGKYR